MSDNRYYVNLTRHQCRPYNCSFLALPYQYNPLSFNAFRIHEGGFGLQRHHLQAMILPSSQGFNRSNSSRSSRNTLRASSLSGVASTISCLA